MDDEDIRIRTRDRVKKTALRRQTPWIPVLLNLVRNQVLKTTDDYVLVQNLALVLQAPEHEVNKCLTGLIEEGLLTKKQVVDPAYSPVKVGGKYSAQYWHEGKWIFGFGDNYIVGERGDLFFVSKPGFRDTRARASKMETAKFFRKNPPKPSGWDGLANFVVRGKEFQKAAIAAGLPPDPTADWTCPECKKPNHYDSTRCRCGYSIPDGHKRPPVPVVLKTCKRCGQTLVYGREFHSKAVCDLEIVREIMTE